MYRSPNVVARGSSISPNRIVGAPLVGGAVGRRSFVGARRSLVGNTRPVYAAGPQVVHGVSPIRTSVIGAQGGFRRSIVGGTGTPVGFVPPQGSTIPGFRRSVVGPSSVVGAPILGRGSIHGSIHRPPVQNIQRPIITTPVPAPTTLHPAPAPIVKPLPAPLQGIVPPIQPTVQHQNSALFKPRRRMQAKQSGCPWWLWLLLGLLFLSVLLSTLFFAVPKLLNKNGWFGNGSIFGINSNNQITTTKNKQTTNTQDVSAKTNLKQQQVTRGQTEQQPAVVPQKQQENKKTTNQNETNTAEVTGDQNQNNSGNQTAVQQTGNQTTTEQAGNQTSRQVGNESSNETGSNENVNNQSTEKTETTQNQESQSSQQSKTNQTQANTNQTKQNNQSQGQASNEGTSSEANQTQTSTSQQNTNSTTQQNKSQQGTENKTEQGSSTQNKTQQTTSSQTNQSQSKPQQGESKSQENSSNQQSSTSNGEIDINNVKVIQNPNAPNPLTSLDLNPICTDGYFLHNSKCIKCPEGSSWNGANCISRRKVTVTSNTESHSVQGN